MFWNNVKLLLKANGYTQKSLSVALGSSERTVEQWINRGTVPDIDTALKIASLLHTTVEYLATGQESNIYKDKYDSLVTAIKELPIF